MNARNLGRIGLLVAALAVAGGASVPAQAHGGHGGHGGGHAHVGVGFYFGPGWGWGYGYPYAYPYPYYYPGYYPPAAAAVPSSPPQYIEQGDVNGGEAAGTYDPGAPAPAVWYHCSKPEGYYPYIRDCPGGWEQVPAQPPSS